MNLLIRNEKAEDIDGIHLLTKEAFSDVLYASHTEQFIVDELRKLGALTLSLVALYEAKIVGHVAFSPVTVTDSSTNWFALGPVSVTPDLQKKGIGVKLINTGLDTLKALGANGCVLVGDPNYYSKFGFKSEQGFIYQGLAPEYFQVLAFNNNMPHGEVAFHHAFSVKG